MEKIRKKWSSMDLFGKCSYLSVGLLFFLIPFTVSAKYCYVTHELRLHQNDRCKRFTLF